VAFPPAGHPADTAGVLLAAAVAVAHGAAVVLMLCGALLALRWQRAVWVHVPVALGILAVNLAGAPCPLTELELALRADAGAPVYTGGFLGHYVFAPLGLDVRSAGVRAAMYTVALGLNLLGYGLLAQRHGPGRWSDADHLERDGVRRAP
jgi:hypothetical protein